MPRVYQRAESPRRAPCALVLSSLLLGACGGSARDVEPMIARRAVPFDSILGTRAFELVAAASARDGGRIELLATESSVDGARALLVPVDLGSATARQSIEKPAPSALAFAGASESRAVAALSHGLFLIEELDGATRVTRAVLVDGRGRRVPLAPAGEDERFLVVADDGQRFWSAARARSGSDAAAGAAGELLIETALPGGARRVVDLIEPPFVLAALSGDGLLAALRRPVHDEADEIVLLERASREMRLLLPDRDEGRFRPLAFLAGRLLLLLADDGGDQLRFERLALATGDRTVLAPRAACAAAGMTPLDGGQLRLDWRCGGARHAERAELSGRALPLPEPPAGTRAVAFAPLAGAGAGKGAFALAAAGPRWPADLWLARAGPGLTPLTYALAPGLQPAALPEPEALSVASAGAALPAEIWPSWGAPRGGVLWLEDGAAPAAWGELEPTFAALQSRGFAVLRYRGRGADGFGRRLRRAADGDPTGAALADLGQAAAVLERRLGGRRIALVGQGEWEGGVALAAAAKGEGDRFAAVAALFPSPDPLAALDLVTAASEPKKSWLLRRWGDDDAERARWRFPAGAARRPTLVLLDRDRAESAGLAAAVDAARAQGAPVEAALVRRLRFTPRLARDAALRLAELCERHLAGVGEPASESRTEPGSEIGVEHGGEGDERRPNVTAAPAAER